MKALKVFVVLLLSPFSLPLTAQNQPTPSWAACGNIETEFSINLDKSQHSLQPPDPGKARSPS